MSTINSNRVRNAGNSSADSMVAGRAYAVTIDNRLISFNPANPQKILSDVSITDVQEGDMIIAIDFRPRTGQLWGISQNKRIYTINPLTGAALGAAQTPLQSLIGTNFVIDFDPVADRLRVTSETDINVRIDPQNGEIDGIDPSLIFDQNDTNLGKDPDITGLAYSDSFSGAGAATLFGIDSDLDILVRIGSPDGTPVPVGAGRLQTIGSLGIDAPAMVGFDIVSPGNIALAAFPSSGTNGTSLYTINLENGSASIIGSIGIDTNIRDIAVGVRVETIYALNENNKLLCFSSGQPDQIKREVVISGLAPGESILAIDFRPMTGELYGISNLSGLYVIDLSTGAVSRIGTSPLAPAINGTAIGLDFNPVSDRLRLVSETGQNLRINPNNGSIIGDDPALSYVTNDTSFGVSPHIVGIAFSDNFPGTTDTTLYGLDTSLDTLVVHGSIGGMMGNPDSGQLSTIGPLGINTLDLAGFDIAAETDAAFASLTMPAANFSTLYTVNLLSGAATMIGEIGGGSKIVDIAIIRPVIATVNAASFTTGPAAPDSLAAIFGNFHTDGGAVKVAQSLPLPVSLGGVSVKIGGADAQLLVTSPGQINLLMPSVALDGEYTITVTNNDGTSRTGIIGIARNSPGIFTFLANGEGTAAALWTNDGVTFNAVFNQDGSESPIPPGNIVTPTFLILYVTGIRNAPAADPGDGNGVAESVMVMLNDVPTLITYAGPAPGFAGLDQVNLVVPPELAGSGTITVRLLVNGLTSNIAIIKVGTN